MANSRRRYEKDFYFTHYMKFILPFWTFVQVHVGAIILFFITYGMERWWFHLFLSPTHFYDIWYIYFGFVSLNYLRTRIPWARGATRASASIKLAGNTYRGEIPIRPVDMKNYIAQKANKNVFICGTSGQGKSYLTRYLLGLYDNQKLIFNFKPNDEYLKLGYPIVDMSKAQPNAFRNAESFVNAFLITFPLDNVGITAQYIPTFVRELAKESGTWQEFDDAMRRKLAHTRDKIQQSALLFIQEHAKNITSKEAYAVEIGEGNLVFDFSYLNQDAKTFYAELTLRQLWHDISNERLPNVLICVDEAHRLLHRFEKYESIYNEMAREIRAFGMLWTSTQNYSDMHEDIRNQFAAQFIFNTSHPDDLADLYKNDDALSWSASSLPLHYFTDARYEWLHEIIPEFTLFYNKKDSPKTFYEGIKPEAEKDTGKVAHAIDYAQEIRDILSEQPAYATQIGKLIAKKYGIDKDMAKLAVKTALNKMRANDEVASMKLMENGKAIVVYYIKSANLSELHEFMQARAVQILKDAGLTITAQATTGQRSAPDIETKELIVEIETGLKHSSADLKARIARYNKRAIVVVPNDEVAEKYLTLKGDNIDVSTLDNLAKLLKETK